MGGSHLIELGHFIGVLKIRDMHELSRFYGVNEMDGPQAIALEYFVIALKSEGVLH